MWSVAFGVVKILSILEFKGRQRCKAKVLPRGAQAGRVFEPACPRAGARRRNGSCPAQGTHGKFREKLWPRPGGTRGLREVRVEGNLLSPNPFCLIVPRGVPWFCPPGRR